MARRKGWLKKRLRFRLKKDALFSIAYIVLFCLAGVIGLSFSRQGVILYRLNTALVAYFGWAVVFVVFFLLLWGLMFTKIEVPWNQTGVLSGGALLAVALIGLTRSGLIGQELFAQIAYLITPVGAYIVLTSCCLIGFVVFFNTSFDRVLFTIASVFRSLVAFINRLKPAPRPPSFKEPEARLPISQPNTKETLSPKPATPQSAPGQSALPLSTFSGAQVGVWTYPPISLLEDRAGKKADRGDIKGNAATIERTLDSFGISAHVVEVNYGPAVTQYAIEVALGTKLSKITSLSNDLALALAAPGGQIRVEAPIPGRPLVGIELPNRSAEGVTLKEILASDAMKSTKSKLAIPLGLDVSGKAKVSEISKMPHVLIAGQTGSGKSVMLNSWIATLLFRASPSELNLIMVDPKRVELTPYNDIPHLITPVIHDADKVVGALEWATREMDRRYKVFAQAGARNIDIYNEMAAFQAMPYIVIIIDELADIMLFAPARVEDAICRIAQMARATGIHLVIATQRPSVDVLTGLIKANIPARISFAVSSQVDSRVIIDTPGAEKLLGKGDMLYIPPDQAKPTRIQGAYVSEEEIKRLTAFLRASGYKPGYTDNVTEVTTPLSGGRTVSTGSNDANGRDEFFAEAARLVCQTQKASASFLQRKLSIGYARAARVIDQLQEAGIVGPGEGSKPREVLTKDAESFLANGQE